jgi:periplasmic protein TonB
VAASQHTGFRSLGRGTGAGVLLTLLVHGAIGAVAYVSQVRAEREPEAARDLVVTQLVTLGKPREKFLLPRITEPPKPKAPAPQIKVTDDPLKPPPPQPKEKEKEPPKPPEKPEPSNDLKRALARARALSNAVPEESNEGEATGSLEGTANVAQEGDAYATAVHAAIQRNWTAPTGLVNEAELAGLRAEVRVTIGPDGRLGEPTMRRPSGNQYFDDSCIGAVKATGQVPPPPPAVAAKFRRGILLEFEGKNLAR